MIFYSVAGKNGLAVMLNQLMAEKMLPYMGYGGKVQKHTKYMEAEKCAKKLHREAGGKDYNGITKVNKPIWNKNI